MLPHFPLSTLGIVLAVLLFLALLVALSRRGGRFPYVAQKALFTPAERAFLIALDRAVAPDQRVFGKVRLADIARPQSGLKRSVRQTAFNRISAKHFDFVVCRAADLMPLCAVELDDASHRRPAAAVNDTFKNKLCAAIGLPLLRVRARRGYSVPELQQELARAIAEIPR